MNKLLTIVLAILAIGIGWCYLNGTCPLQAAFGAPKTGATKIAEQSKSKMISGSELKARLDKGEKLTIIDVRTKEEYAEGHLPNSILLPYDEIMSKASQLPTDKTTELVVYCRSGRRSAEAAKTLIKMGYVNVYDMGAYTNWSYGLVK